MTSFFEVKGKIMKIDNLELKTYPNYKALCLALGVPVKTGEAKQIQVKDFERYFNYQRQGNKYIITEIFSTPKEKESKKIKAIYSDLLSILILSNSTLFKGYCSVTDIAALFLNERYYGQLYLFKTEGKEWCERTFNDFFTSHHFFRTVDNKVYSIIDYCLTSMEKKGLITVKDVRLITLNTNRDFVSRAMTEDEIETRNDIVDETIEKMNKEFEKNIVQEYQVQFQSLELKRQFYKTLTERMKEKFEDYVSSNRAYELYKLTTIKYDSKEVEEAKMTLNKRLCNFLVDSIDNHIAKCLTEWAETGKGLNYNNRFEDNFERLIDFCVRIK